jgi:hypothetical protein
MRYVKVKGHYPYQHRIEGEWVESPNGVRFKLPDADRLEVIEPGSVVGMADDLAKSFVARGRGVFCDGPEHLIRPAPSDAPAVERPGFDARPSRAEKAVGAPQRAGAV